MPSPAISDEREGWLRTEPLQLRSDVELITGAGGRPMLVSPHGKFLSVSPSGVTIIRRLDQPTTGQALISTLLAEHPEQEVSIRTVLPVFLTDLRRASLLTIDPDPPARSWSDRFIGLGKLDPVKRFPLIQDPNRLSGPVSSFLARIPVPLLYAALVLLPLTSIALMVPALRLPPDDPPNTAFFVGAIAVMLCEIFLHESAHAVAMAFNRVRAKNAGVGLLFRFIPLAYVDRTDSYRHQGRFGRVLISLVGPLVDLVLAGVSAAVIMNSSGAVATFFHLLLLMQILSLLANLNPLFPSDGYHAVEAAVGSINMRSRALTFALHEVSRRPLPLYLRNVSRRIRVGYVVYVVVSVGYTLLVAAILMANILALASRLM